MAKKIEWQDFAGNSCVVSIEDGRSGTSSFTPADEPFSTEIAEDDDIFTPIRTGCGYIRINVDDIDDINDLVGSSPINRKVTLKVNGTLRWTGFLSCEIFTQSWDVGPLEIELPVFSPLEVAKSLTMDGSVISNLQYISFAEFLVAMNTALLNPYSTIFFPCLTEPETTLRYLFDLRNYTDSVDKNTSHEFANYHDILEDVCKLFGWQCIEIADSLCFLAADSKKLENGSAYKGYTPAQLQTLVAGGSVVPVTLPFNVITPVIYGDEHSRTFVPGKKTVTVTGSLNERDEIVWEMDVLEYAAYAPDSNPQGDVGTTVYKVKSYKTAYADGRYGNIRTRNNVMGMNVYDTSGIDVKFTNFHGEQNYGGSVAFEKMYKYNLPGHEIVEGEDDFVPRILTKGIDGMLLSCAEIYTNFFYTPTQNDDVFKIDADIKYAEDADDIFDHLSELYCRVVLRIGDYYYNPESGWGNTSASVLLHVKDGNIVGYGRQTDRGVIFNSSIPAPTNLSGEVILYILATTDDLTDYGQGSGYVSYENVKIRLLNNNPTRNYLTRIEDKEQRKDSNTKRVSIQSGFTSEWDMESGLTVAREPVPDSFGAVLTSDKRIPGNLYDSKYPEEALAYRAASYFVKSRQKINAIVMSEGKMLDPLVPYQFKSGGQQFICVSQKMNWRSNRVEGIFYEPSDEE